MLYIKHNSVKAWTLKRSVIQHHQWKSMNCVFWARLICHKIHKWANKGLSTVHKGPATLTLLIWKPQSKVTNATWRKLWTFFCRNSYKNLCLRLHKKHRNFSSIYNTACIIFYLSIVQDKKKGVEIYINRVLSFSTHVKMTYLEYICCIA